LHLGHRKNPTAEIIENLKKAFPDNAETAELDIIFLAGDVFHDLMNLSDEEVWDIKFWVAHFLRLCKKHDILVRVLEGTPSHDWKQSEIFPNTNTLAGIGAELKYVKELSIEYIERYGITVLYVPDEWETTTDKTLSQVHELLKAKGLTKVDYAIMHGTFDHQLPSYVKSPVHNASAYLSLVKNLILIGHIHTYTQFDRIIAQGSFDRLAHGEEEPKGHIRATVRDNGKYQITFVENKGAKKFITVHCFGLTLPDTLALIEEKVKDLPANSFVRVEADSDNPIFENMEMLIRQFPFYSWSKLPSKTIEEEKSIVDKEELFVPITLTKDNLKGLLIERMVNNGASDLMLDAANSIMVEVE